MTATQEARVQTAGLDEEEILAQMERILQCEQFRRSPRLSAFLRHVVTETLAGRARLLKGFNIAVEVFGRDQSFDSSTDPLVRVHARNLRLALEKYYEGGGSDDPIRITIPTGVYSCSFASREKRAIRGNALSVAVLPFAMIGSDDNDAFLAEGITHELVTAFTRYSELDIAVRQATVAYRGFHADARRIGKELSVRFVLQGSVQVAGDEVRVSAQLLDAASGNHVWAQDYDRTLSTQSLFTLQDDIAAAVVSRIAGILGIIYSTVEKETRQSPPTSLTVNEAMVRFYDYVRTLHIESYKPAREALEAIVDSNPDFAPALSMLAELVLDGLTLRHIHESDGLDRADRMVESALILDPNNVQAIWMQAQVRFHRRNREGCIASLNRVLELNPHATFFTGCAGWMMALVGEWERGLELLHTSVSYNPRHPGWFHLAPFQDCYRREDFQGALTYAIKFNMPELPWDQAIRIAAYQAAGQLETAQSVVAELLAYKPDFGDYADEYLGRFIFDDELKNSVLARLGEAGLEVVPAG